VFLLAARDKQQFGQVSRVRRESRVNQSAHLNGLRFIHSLMSSHAPSPNSFYPHTASTITCNSIIEKERLGPNDRFHHLLSSQLSLSLSSAGCDKAHNDYCLLRLISAAPGAKTHYSVPASICVEPRCITSRVSFIGLIQPVHN
jgi:hypothetical protein